MRVSNITIEGIWKEETSVIFYLVIVVYFTVLLTFLIVLRPLIVYFYDFEKHVSAASKEYCPKDDALCI